MIMRSLCLLVLVGACGSKPGPVDLSGKWPAQCGDYEEVTEAWTRKEQIQNVYQEILELVAAREQARKDRDWKKADTLRDSLLERGVVVEDGAGGSRLKRRS